MTSTQRTASLAIPGGRFLIVGGASLVGSTTADLLLAQGAAEVVILDNFSFGARETIARLMAWFTCVKSGGRYGMRRPNSGMV